MNSSLENAIVRLLKRRPFFGHLVLGCRREESQEKHALGITIRSGLPVLTVNGSHFAAEDQARQEALIEHVLKHLLHLHMGRRKDRNRHDWDIACDLAINPGISGLPVDALHPEVFGLEPGLAAEEYYGFLGNRFDCGNLKGEGTGGRDRDSGGRVGSGEDQFEREEAPTCDDHGVWADADTTPVRLAEEVVRTMVREATRASDGEIPAEIVPLVSTLLAPAAIPWRKVLDQFVAAASRVGRKSTWMREHRRFEHGTPGIRKRHRLNLLVGIDVSDSTNTAELREAFARELVRLARGRDSQITVMYANSRINRIEAFRDKAVVPQVYLGGGFTDLRPLFEEARRLRPAPAAVIYMTDGMGPAPEKMEFPTLWVLTGDGEKPVAWGVELRLEV